MAKKYSDIKTEPLMAEEPVSPYNVCRSSHIPSKETSTRERVMGSTVSVDAYFDELISLVHKDYENL